MLQLAWPWLLLALPLPFLVRRLIPATQDHAQGTLFIPFTRSMADRAETSQPDKSQRWLFWLGLLAWLFLVLATARPQWLGEPLELPETGRNLMLAIDASGSMETPDLDLQQQQQVNRLEVVKQVAGDFIERRTGDRIGLIIFGSRAYLQSPLSFDRKTVHSLLDDAAIGIAGKETAIGDGVGLAIKRLQNAPAGEAVLILLTDGANTAGRVSPRKAAELAAQANLRIYTIGIGAQRLQVQTPFGLRQINPSSELDEDTLQYMAEVTGGSYFRATSRESLADIYQQLDALEPVSGGAQTVRPVQELYHWPLAMAFMITLLLAVRQVWLGFRKGAAQ